MNIFELVDIEIETSGSGTFVASANYKDGSPVSESELDKIPSIDLDLWLEENFRH